MFLETLTKILKGYKKENIFNLNKMGGQYQVVGLERKEKVERKKKV